MRSARSLRVFPALLLFSGVTGPAFADLGPPARLADNRGLVRARQPLPDDPLAGLPTEDGGRPGKGGKGGGAKAATCKVDGKPANPRDIGDLRATLALVERGPRVLRCPARALEAGIGLRITVDGAGKITQAEALGGTSELATAIAKRLRGKSIAARREGATSGTVWLIVTPGKPR